MPNGDDKNLRRLEACVAVYFARFKTWPTHARFEAGFLWDIVHVMHPEDFRRLAERMEIRTEQSTSVIGISVGGPAGVQRYDNVDYDRLPLDAREAARRWLELDS